MAAAGETDLEALLRTMQPSLHPSTFVYAALPPTTTLASLPASLHIQALVRETEGLAIITTKESALHHAEALNLRWEFECRMITLTVHSSLEAVGFMARISHVLGEKRVPCNVVAGFYHDHVFVPVGREGECMDLLQGIAAGTM